PRASRGRPLVSNCRGLRDATFGLARSGDLNGVLEVRGDLLGERNDEVPVEGGGDPGEGVDAVACSSAFLEPGDDRLGGAHPLGELALGELASVCRSSMSWPGARFYSIPVLVSAATAGRCFLLSSQRE